jgi:proteasome assembly chaperone (PAC2) family protein
MKVPEKLKSPWLVAVWPGMGHVATSAGYYLIAKLGMHLLAEFSPRELFEVEHVEVKDGLIRTGQLPWCQGLEPIISPHFRRML